MSLDFAIGFDHDFLYGHSAYHYFLSWLEHCKAIVECLADFAGYKLTKSF